MTMGLKIDGYEPADKKVALEQGVTFDYDLEFGSITIRSRTLDFTDNPQFGMAYKVYQEWAQRRQRLNSKSAEDEAERRFLGILYDHGVMSWETTITSDGEPISPTRENFIELMRAKPCRKVAVMYFEDATDENNFRAVSREEDEGNSAPPSAGKSSGRGGGKNG